METTTTKGDTEFVLLLSDAQEEVFLFIVSLLGDADTAKDVLQETNLLAWKRQEQFDPAKGSFPAWMKAVAHSRVLAARQRMKREADKIVFADDIFEKLAASPLTIPDGDRQVALKHCLARLSLHERRLLNAHYLDGISLKALAKRCRIEEAAMRKRFQRMRMFLADCILRHLCRLQGYGEFEQEERRDVFLDRLKEELLVHGLLAWRAERIRRKRERRKVRLLANLPRIAAASFLLAAGSALAISAWLDRNTHDFTRSGQGSAIETSKELQKDTDMNGKTFIAAAFAATLTANADDYLLDASTVSSESVGDVRRSVVDLSSMKRIATVAASGEGISAALFAISEDGVNWLNAGELSASEDGWTSEEQLLCIARYVRVDSTPADVAPQISVRQTSSTIASAPYTYTYCSDQPQPARADRNLTFLNDGAIWMNVTGWTTNSVVQIGSKETPGSNATVNVAFSSGANTLRRMTFTAGHGSDYGTGSVEVSNKVDGVWQLLASTDSFEAFKYRPTPDASSMDYRRFSLALGDTSASELVVVAKMAAGSARYRQLIAEISFDALAGEREQKFDYSYTFSQAPSGQQSQVDNAIAPRMNDGNWGHNFRSGIRFDNAAELSLVADFSCRRCISRAFFVAYNYTTTDNTVARTKNAKVFASDDGETWHEVGSADFPDVHECKVDCRFSEPVLCRYAKVVFNATDDASSQCLAECNFFGPRCPDDVGSPVELSVAIANGGFELPALSADTSSTSADGWTVSQGDGKAGIFRGSVEGISKTYNGSTKSLFAAKEGSQSAYICGSDSGTYLETRVTIEEISPLMLQFTASPTCRNSENHPELAGFDFTVLFDGKECATAKVLSFADIPQYIYLGVAESGEHTLRFAAKNSSGVNTGAIIDGVKLLRLPEASAFSAGRQNVFASTFLPTGLFFAGEIKARTVLLDAAPAIRADVSSAPSQFTVGPGSLKTAPKGTVVSLF